MFIVLGPYVLLGFLATLGFAGWASWVAADKYRNLNSDLRREIILGMIVIALLAGPVAVIAAYWSPRLEQPSPLQRS